MDIFKCCTITVNSDIFARVLFTQNEKVKPSRNGKNTLSITGVNHALVANFNMAHMSFNAIRENRVLAKVLRTAQRPIYNDISIKTF